MSIILRSERTFFKHITQILTPCWSWRETLRGNVILNNYVLSIKWNNIWSYIHRESICFNVKLPSQWLCHFAHNKLSNIIEPVIAIINLILIAAAEQRQLTRIGNVKAISENRYYRKIVFEGTDKNNLAHCVTSRMYNHRDRNVHCYICHFISSVSFCFVVNYE